MKKNVVSASKKVKMGKPERASMGGSTLSRPMPKRPAALPKTGRYGY